MEKIICLNRSVLDFMASKLTPESFVLEIGGGWSSRWFMERCRQLVIVEENPKWRRLITQELIDLQGWTIYTNLDAVQGWSEVDLALIDCIENMRYRAARKAWQSLAPGGWIVFDDAQRDQHFVSVAWLTEHAGDPVRLMWQEGDIETAIGRLALAWQKPTASP